MSRKQANKLLFLDLIKTRLSPKGKGFWTLILTILAIFIVAGLAVRDNKISAFADASEAKSLPAVESPAIPNAVMPMQEAIPADAELLILTPEGFKPSAITRKPGPFLLEVIDRSGLDQITLQLNSEGGAQMQTSSSLIQQAQTQNVFNLPAGTYVYAEADHPEWTCTITVAP